MGIPVRKNLKKQFKRINMRYVQNILLCLIGILAVILVISYIRLVPVYNEAKSRVYDILADMDTGTFRRQTNTMIYDKDGNLIGKLGYERYDYKDISDISDYIQQGYIDVEDRNFKIHNGVDFTALLRAGFSFI